ncbi:hypothetical protein PSH90_12040 [Pseudomonas sp. FP1762]|uniref:hypothetical protein n=1 Tax=Pseudomonas sp. FP1762 TaxID=2954080 RepID=UPI002732D949|nr:hypothetical protein [Pseudomonas sp. FP1762]WLG64795.1 hypothetical protein PSH90_12040 [Pseudomonas sp. FP1762]
MSGIERIIEALTAPPPPAAEVVSLDRGTVERALALLESHPDIAQGGPSLCQEVCAFRQAMAEPKVELWAIHSVGPGEQYPRLNKEDAEQKAKELRELGERMKQERIARGESVEHWQDWVTNVIPSPWEPAEHFEILAEECVEDADHLRQALIELKDQRNEIVEVLKGVEKRCERMGYVGVDGQYLKVVRAAIAKATE